MPSLGGRFTTATLAAYQTWRQIFQNPAAAKIEPSYYVRLQREAYLWAWYDGTVFDWPQFAQVLKQDERLYRQTRIINNPVTRLVDFWASIIYPGVLSHDGKPLPRTVPLAIPFPNDMPDDLKGAVAQFCNWSNYQSQKATRCRYAAIAGSCLTEIIDDVEGGRVFAHALWPSLVRDVIEDEAGGLLSYTLEYWARNDPHTEHGQPVVAAPATETPQEKAYVYRKEVDLTAIRTYKDGKPFDYESNIEGGNWEYENPYGFVPAVWDKHIDVGSTFGVPAIGATLKKLLELNSILSHLHDQMHKVIASPIILWTDDNITNLLSATNNTKRGNTDGLSVPDADKESLMILKGSAGGRVDTLAGDRDLWNASGYIEALLKEIERDHPELVMYDALRSMSQVTGPAAEVLLGDVALRVAEVRAGYDQKSVELFQKGVGIGGWRLGRGDWGPVSGLTTQQKRFEGFNLESFASGDLDFWILPRPLVPEAPPSPLERAQIAAIKMTYGVTNDMLQKEDGYTDEEIADMSKKFADQQAERLAMANMSLSGGGDAAPDVPGSAQPNTSSDQSAGGQAINAKTPHKNGKAAVAQKGA